MKYVKILLPGFLICLLISVLAKIVNHEMSLLGEVTLAVIIGLFLGVIIKDKGKYQKGTDFCNKYLLKIGIALLGVRLNYTMIAKLGLKTVLFLTSIVFLTILVSWILGIKRGLSSKLSFLYGAGMGICGNAAMISIAPVLKSDNNDLAKSIGLTNLFGLVGVFLMPITAVFLKFDLYGSSILIGSTLQSVGHVVASGYSMGDKIGDLSVVIKMVRVLLLGPVMVFAAHLFADKNHKKTKLHYIPPFFIIMFFIFGLVSTFGILNSNILKIMEIIGKNLVLISMAAIGFKIEIKDFFKDSKILFYNGILIVVFQIILTLLFVKFIF